jgi:PHP family Zn ribbon phosphoesterase
MMVPSLIVAQALERELKIIAVTDHNTTDNVEAVMLAARGTDLVVIPGMELETREEVHVVVLLPDLASAREWQRFVFAHLPDLPNDDMVFGAQVVMDAEDELVRYEQRRLLVASDLSIDEAVKQAHRFGGFCVPAHVDRPSYGLLGVLVFIPPELDAPAVELSRHIKLEDAVRRWPELLDRTLVRSSDAHTLEDIGVARTLFELEQPTLAELELAYRGLQGRHICWEDHSE